jgi:multidrug efflux pump subunit AcrB
VRASVQGVLREALIAACLTGLMILLSLGSWRATLIIAVSIPLSMITSIIDSIGLPVSGIKTARVRSKPASRNGKSRAIC